MVLENLLQEHEQIVKIHLTAEYVMRQCISTGGSDIHADLEMTLHQFIEEGASKEEFSV